MLKLEFFGRDFSLRYGKTRAVKVSRCECLDQFMRVLQTGTEKLVYREMIETTSSGGDLLGPRVVAG